MRPSSESTSAGSWQPHVEAESYIRCARWGLLQLVFNLQLVLGPPDLVAGSARMSWGPGQREQLASAPASAAVPFTSILAWKLPL
jgi:hypothetical protein